jgi:hypothetical protein
VPNRHTNQSGDHHGDIGNSGELFEHHQHPCDGSHRQDIAEANPREGTETEEQEFKKGSRFPRTGCSDKALLRPDLADQINVSKRPREEGKGAPAANNSSVVTR